jgi:hypothetical protein
MRDAEQTIAPGSVVVVGNEEWLITVVAAASDGRAADGLAADASNGGDKGKLAQ